MYTRENLQSEENQLSLQQVSSFEDIPYIPVQVKTHVDINYIDVREG